MFKIPRVEKSSFYIDQIMKAMQEYAQKEKLSIQERWSRNLSTKRKDKDDINFNKRKDLELQKVRFINERVNRDLKKIMSRFPDFRKVDEIYLKLINTSETPVESIKDSMGRIKWICDSCDTFSQNTEYKLKTTRSNQTIGFIMKKYLGKVNSLFSKNKKYFIVLNDAVKYMNKLPTFKEIYTVSIAGFPNVGKSTLMKEISGSNVEIQNYPFTTKGLMFSYLKHNSKDVVQLIDTPGLLNRKESNPIEERAKIALKDYSNLVVFVLDVTESCGFRIEDQLKLLKETSKDKTEILIYLSKTDIFNEEDEETLEEHNSKLKKFEIFKDKEKLKNILINHSLDKEDKFDPKKIKLIK